ncbi:hypothetical protein QQG55_55870 [Brugia pahangi]
MSSDQLSYESIICNIRISSIWVKMKFSVLLHRNLRNKRSFEPKSSMTLMDVRLYQKCCKRSLSSKQLIYEKYGHPANVHRSIQRIQTTARSLSTKATITAVSEMEGFGSFFLKSAVAGGHSEITTKRIFLKLLDSVAALQVNSPAAYRMLKDF